MSRCSRHPFIPPANNLMMPQGRVRIISSLEELKELKDPWEQLEEQCGCGIFSSYLCVSEWVRCFGDLVEPSVLVIGSKDDIEYIAPLAVRKGKMHGLPVRVLGMIGTILDSSEYYNLTFLKKKGKVGDLDALVDGMASIKWDVLQLLDMENDELLPPLVEKLKSRWSCEMKPSRPSPIVTLDMHNDPIENFEPRTNKRIRRIIDELKKDSRFETRLVKTPDMVERALNRYAELHIARWESKGGSIFKDARQRDFLITMPVEMAKMKKAWVMEILIDGETASQQLCLVDKDCIRMYRMVMNDAFKSFAPGYLAAYFAMLEAKSNGSNTFDMGPGQDEYKYKVGGIDHPNYAIEGKRGKVMMASRLLHLVKKPSNEEAPKTD